MAEKIPIESNDDSLQKSIGVFGEDWVKGDPIGSGGFGTVYLVKSLRDNSEPKYVVKEILVFQNNENTKTVGSLRKYSESKNGLGEEATMRFTRQILEGLAFLHENRIIHRDVKGDNVLMQDERHVRLTDFGISKILQDVSSTATCVGTKRWMAPEVVNTGEGNPKYNKKADIWSVGCTVIEMMTGHSPYKDIQNSPQVIIQIHKGIVPTLGKSIVPSSELSEFLQKTLQPNPEDRPSAEVLLYIDNFVNQVKYTLVLVGTTGEGKSASGNTLLGSRVFYDYDGVHSVTLNVCKGKAKIQRELFEVFDTPGILRTDMSREEDAVSAVENATEIMNRSKRGVTAFLFVFKYGQRFGQCHTESIRILTDIYGPEVINKHGICLVSCGDDFDRFRNTSFNDWCENQGGTLKHFLSQFNKRIVLMRNRGNQIERERCRAEVFDIVRQLSQQQDPYTMEDFKRHETSRQKLKEKGFSSI